jgi:ferrous iron transport protein A
MSTSFDPPVSARDPSGVAASAVTLVGLANGQSAWVRSVGSPADAPEWAERLEEIGFIPGERVTVMARGLPGGDPLVVRVGNSTFALRRAEAACVQISTASL